MRNINWKNLLTGWGVSAQPESLLPIALQSIADGLKIVVIITVIYAAWRLI